MKGYSTKYALTKGIEEVNARSSAYDGADPRYVYAGCVQLVVGKTFFGNEKDACDAAKAMAERKATNLRKQLAKVEKLAKQPKWAKR